MRGGEELARRNRRLALLLLALAVFLCLGAVAFVLWSKGRVKMTRPYHSELTRNAAPYA